jgi:hypothetical protein
MLYDYTVVKTNLVMDGYDKILKSAFPAAVVIERVEILMRVVYCGRALFDVNGSTEIGHTGMEVATGSGVLKLIDNEDNKSSDGGNPRILLTVMENSIDKVTS